MKSRRVGILGGTFDPIHCGHIDAGRAADDALGFDELLVVPSNVPPHRPQPVASPFHRFAMAALAIAGIEGWRTSDMELRDQARSFTSATLERLHARGYDPVELFFVLGADAFAEIASWKDYPTILDAAHFVVVSRPGMRVALLPARLPELATRMVWAQETLTAARDVSPALPWSRPSLILIDAPTADVSSTAIRQRLSIGESIEGMVPAAVAQYIERQHLYRATESAAGSTRQPDHPAAGRLHGED